MHIKVHAEARDLALHVSWLQELSPEVDVALQRHPDISVLALSFPLSFGERVDAILRHWEREHPGTVDRD